METDEQTEHLQRVSARIGAAIIQFIGAGRGFYADQLRQHVAASVGPVAPCSAYRILRLLRQQGHIGYLVLSRRNSLYRVWVVPKQTEMKLSP